MKEILDDHLARGEEENKPKRAVWLVILEAMYHTAIIAAAPWIVMWFIDKCIELYNLLK